MGDVITTPVGKTKNDIWAAYKELVAELKSLREGKTVTIADTAKKQTVNSAITVAESQDKGKLEHLLESLMSLSDEYNQVCLAINEKKSELKEVHSIAVEADTYVALVQAKQKIIADRESEAIEIVENAKQHAEEILNVAHDKEQEIARQIQDSIDKYNQDKTRAEEAFTYDFERRKKQREDSLNDQLALKGKSLDERESLIKAREDKAKEVDAIIENLEDALDKAKVEKDSDVKREVAIATNVIERNKKYEIETLKTQHVAVVAIKENETRMLSEQIVDLKAQVAKLQSAVDSASERVTSIATASMNAKASEAKVEAVMEAVKNSNQQTKR